MSIRQLFRIVSKRTHKVLAVKGGSRQPGTQVVMETASRDEPLSQLWYEDDQELLRSALDSSVLTSDTEGIKHIFCFQ